MMRNPSSPSTLTTAASNPSSPAKAARPMRARMRTPSASGRCPSKDGRRTGPISTRSSQPNLRRDARMRPGLVMPITSCGQGASTAGSALPSRPTMNTRRPAARAAAATWPGSGPPPASMPRTRGASCAGADVAAATVSGIAFPPRA